MKTIKLAPGERLVTNQLNRKGVLPQSIVDLSKITDQDRIVGRESAEEWGFERLDELWSGMDLEGRGR